MDVKEWGQRVFGGLLLIVGCALLLSQLRLILPGRIAYLWIGASLPQSLFRVGGLVLLAALSVYLAITGLRMINPALIQPPRFGWGKIVFGTWMLYSQIGAYFHLVPDGPIPLLKPDNANQAASMHVTGVVLCLVFLYLIFRGVRAGLSRPQT